MSVITVCTPTYNRSHTLHIPFNSLCKQTFKDFEWLVIDDGSIDDTEQVIEQFKRIADFPIMYIKTENHGKAAALNTSYNYVKSKYYMILDSDDEYLDDTLEKVYNAWKRIPNNEYKRFWCVTGHCIDSKTGRIIGGEWPYKNVKPRIIAEEYIGTDLVDYKFLCNNGKVKNMFTCSGRGEGRLFVDFFDLNWNHLDFERHYPNSEIELKKPKKFEKMIELSEILSKELLFVRIDFYNIDGKIYFGETTFYPGSGFEEFTPDEWDLKLGKEINLKR